MVLLGFMNSPLVYFFSFVLNKWIRINKREKLLLPFSALFYAAVSVFQKHLTHLVDENQESGHRWFSPFLRLSFIFIKEKVVA